MDLNERLEEFNAPKRMGPFRRAVLRGWVCCCRRCSRLSFSCGWATRLASTCSTRSRTRCSRSRWSTIADIRTPDEPEAQAKTADTVVDRWTAAAGVVEGHDHAWESRSLSIARKTAISCRLHVYKTVLDGVGREPMPTTATDVYRWYVDHRWLQRRFVVPIFICIFLLALYLLGKFLAAGVGRFFWNQFERLIHRVPLVSNVYSSIKQVTDFLFSEPEMQYTRVVALEYPRRGIWTLGFVTGEPMHDIQITTEETLLSAFVPHSPMPFTGFAVTVKKSETIDLNISVDQAIQWVVSCGVVIPPPPIKLAEWSKPASRRSERLQLSGAAPNNG